MAIGRHTVYTLQVLSWLATSQVPSLAGFVTPLLLTTRVPESTLVAVFMIPVSGHFVVSCHLEF